MTVLCVDPDDDERTTTVAALEAAGLSVVGVASAAEARAALDADVACLVTEHDLPDGTGIELVADVRETTPDVACVLYTDTDPADVDTVALGEVVAEYQPKGDLDRLVDLVEHSVATRSQTAYPLPENETARLAALERFAADPGALSDSFDRLTRIATALFDVDSSAVGLVDAHHENFVSCFGIDIDTLDREDTVCTYAILDDGVTVVEDLADDPRFDSNEVIRAANIRFYAGAPVTTPDGQNIGTFCLYDDTPRTLSADDRVLLEDLADVVAEELALRTRLREAEGPTATDARSDDGGESR